MSYFFSISRLLFGLVSLVILTVGFAASVGVLVGTAMRAAWWVWTW